MYAIKENHCEGWFEVLVRNDAGEVIETSEQVGTRAKAVELVRFHSMNGHFPGAEPEETEEDIPTCHACGQPVSQ